MNQRCYVDLDSSLEWRYKIICVVDILDQGNSKTWRERRKREKRREGEKQKDRGREGVMERRGGRGWVREGEGEREGRIICKFRDRWNFITN